MTAHAIHRLADRIYTILLAAYPTDFRQEYGCDINPRSTCRACCACGRSSTRTPARPVVGSGMTASPLFGAGVGFAVPLVIAELRVDLSRPTTGVGDTRVDLRLHSTR